MTPAAQFHALLAAPDSRVIAKRGDAGLGPFVIITVERPDGCAPLPHAPEVRRRLVLTAWRTGE